MSQLWTLLPPALPSAELIAAVGGHPLVAQLLAQRGLSTPAQARAFLDPAHYTPAPPTALLGVEQAAELLFTAVAKQQNILVWGDFDVDGQTSTSLLVAALHKLSGVERVRFHVPNRFTESHGIRPEKLTEKLADPSFAPQLLLTCDTGITEAAGIGLAKERGLTVIVTDHHDLPPELLNLHPGRDPLWGLAASVVGRESVRRADAIVNPKFLPAADPLRTLPGVGVAYKLVQQLYARCGHSGEEAELLDLVALGIVADVATQVHDARYLLQMGLEQLRHTRREGLRALMEVARLNPATVDAESIGFQLGPRMNALGRLEDATVAVELLTTRDPIRAGTLAGKMERLNQERRLLTSQTTTAALELIERDPRLLDYNGLVLAQPHWHAGIVGIVAARLVEEFGKPTVLLLNPPGQSARGSARSIPGVDIGGAIAACAPLLLTHGGHPGAAGVSLLPENIDRFRRELDRQIDLHRDEATPVGLLIDAESQPNQLNLALATELRRLAPFGNGNPQPQLLSRTLTVVEDRRMGREGTHRRLTVQSSDGVRLPFVWWNGADATLPSGPLDVVYTVGVNDYRGERSLQLSLVAVRPALVEEISVQASVTTPHKLYDWRSEPSAFHELPTGPQACWYAEGTQLEAGQSIAYAPRTSLLPCPTLVVWSLPPAPELWQQLLETVQPTTIYLCGRATSDDALPAVIRQVGAMCKFALERDQLIQVDRMAARLGSTEAVVRHSLLWLENRGHIRLERWLARDVAQIAAGTGQRHDETAAQLRAELEEQLAEVRAYRRFFQRAKVNELGLAP